MKKNPIYYYINILNLEIIIIFLLFRLIKNSSIQNFKAIYLSNNFYYIIKSDSISYFNSTNDDSNSIYIFNDSQKITTIEESEMISFGVFKNDSESINLLVVKNYVYAIIKENLYCNKKLTEITGYSEVYPYQCTAYICFYVIGIINSSKNLYLYLYKNPKGFCTSEVVSNLTINNVDSNNLSCKLMQSSSNGKVLTCFYQNSNSKEIIATSLNIDITNGKMETISSLTKSKSNKGAKIIKSTLSQDETKSLVCYINDYNNTDCLIYDIIINQWSGYSTYLYKCLLKFSSLNIEYFDNLNEYILYCFQSSSQFNLQKLDSNFDKKEDEKNGLYDLTEKVSECTNYSLSSLIHDSDNVNIFINCDGNILKYKVENPLPQTTIPFTTIPSKTTLTTIISTTPKITILKASTTISTIPATILSSTFRKANIITESFSSYPLIIKSSSIMITQIISFFSTLKENNNELVIIQNKSNKTKEEIINNLDKVMEDYDIGKIYEIFGKDYNIKISPINTKIHENIPTYIDFSNCENILREVNGLNSSNILTTYQIEIINNNEKSLINDVEYAVFNENKERLDLSVCKDEFIIINYQIKLSKINISKINYYSNLGIDIFNSESQFFNDICYSYSEGESDMILKDRISVIYQNFSVCESNCKYNHINLRDNTVSCNCSIKIYEFSDNHPPRLDRIVSDSFTDSNLAVIKCYKLVFEFKNKIQNIGFWIFTVLILLHFPFFVYYFIFNISSIRKYIYIEMRKYHYCLQLVNPIKKFNKIKKKSKKKDSQINNKYIRNNSLKDNTSTTRINKSNNILFDNNASSINKKINSFSSNNIHELLNFNKRKSPKNKKYMKQKTTQPVSLVNYKKLNKNYINTNHEKKLTINNTSKVKNNKINTIISSSKNYSLIQIDANNSTNNKPQNSNLILDNYDYETALKYDKRNFWRILRICILAKENIINIIFFKTPLDLRSLRICLFIFSYSCDLAFNTIFYTNQNISDKYHYEGDNLFLFTLINNSIISFVSSLVSLILVNIFQHMIDSRGDYEDIFRNEEKKMRENKKYKVSKERKFEILDKIRNISFKLKNNIIVFIIIEFSLMLFFYYFVTAFCEVYKKTQISWLLDFVSSFFISFIREIGESLIIAILYILSIRYKLKFIFKIALFFYNL